RRVADLLPPEGDRALPAGQEAEDRLHEGRLARPVGAEDADHLARLDPEVDTEEHRQAAVARGNVAELKHVFPSRSRRGTTPAPSDPWILRSVCPKRSAFPGRAHRSGCSSP